MITNTEIKIILRLSIPIDATKIGKKFLEFCVNKFGGNSDLFRVEQLDKKSLQTTVKEFMIIAAALDPKYSQKKPGMILYRSDMGSASSESSFKGLYLEFVSDESIDAQEDIFLGECFLTKMFQLFNIFNNFEQTCDHWDGIFRNIMRKNPLDEIDFRSSSNYFIYEKGE